MADLEKAAAQAEKENKDLFIVYRGGAWNPEAYGVPERQIFQICMAGRHLKKGTVCRTGNAEIRQGHGSMEQTRQQGPHRFPAHPRQPGYAA